MDLSAPASAFSVYRLAHCYELTDLQHIVITHLCSHLTPASAFPILLASFVFPELHAQVKAYCLAHYVSLAPALFLPVSLPMSCC
ncbi:hypothetical protein PtB15_18B464 [Puccinia triticina]|nr:hypothetical protein PtB15_18B464 [Puccinia triticina]